MQDIGTSVDYMHAKQSLLLRNHSNQGKGIALGRNGPRGLSGGRGEMCLGRLLCPACSNISFQSVLANDIEQS